MAVRTVGVRLTADTTGYISGLQRAGAATKDFTSKMDQAAKGGKLDHVADQAAKFGIAGVAAFGLVVKSAADFDKQMSAVKAATHASAGEIDQLRAAALRAGKDTQFSATDAAEGITELSKAGVQTADVLNGGLKGALDLAAAGQLSVGEAAETAATALTQFKLKGSDVPHIADLLAAGAGKAQGSVHDMGYAFKQSGLVASQFGLSVEDTTGTLAAFASAGLIGSDAGTSFKTMLLSLANPSEKTSKQMEELGISAYDAQGKFVGITNLAGQLQTKLGGLTQKQRDSTLAMIFGTDAIRAANVLYQQGSSGIQTWIDKTNDAGYAAKTAADLTDNLAGDVERLKGSLETMAIEAGSGANGGLRILVKSVGALVDGLGELPPAVSSSLVVLAGVSGAVALGFAGWVKMRQGIASAVEQLNAIGPAGEKAAGKLQTVTSAAGKVAGAFAVLQVAGAIFSSFQSDLNPQIDAAAKGLSEWARQCLLSGEAARLFGADSKDLDRALNGLADHGFSHVTDNVTDFVLGIGGVSSPLDDAKVKADALDQTLTSMVKSGHSAEALGYLEQRAKATGLSVDDLKKLLPSFSGALETTGTAAGKAADANTGLAKGFGSASANAKTMTGDLNAATEAGQSLLDTWTQLNGATLGLDKGMLAAQDAIGAVAKSFKENGIATEGNTRKALENRVAVGEAAKAAAAAAQAKFEETGSVTEASDVYNRYIGQLRKTLLQSTGNKTETDKLIAAYGKLPSSVTTNVRVTGGPAVNSALDDLLVKQRALQNGLSYTSAKQAIQKDLDRNRQKAYADGGWTGPGAKYDPAGVVHADEFVVQKESRQSVERSNPGALDYINATGRLPGYAGGGQVWPFPTTAAMTRIPSKAEAMSVITPAGPSGGGQTYKWIEQVVHAAFPGMRVLSDVRPGARTLSGNLSYHGFGRAVDFPPSLPLAEWINLHYKARTKELITPWNSLNIHNGMRHAYTGAIFNQHNFAGGNAHDHWAMAGGGVIPEPVFGVGASGRTYSFAENGPERVLPTYASMGGGRGGAGPTVVVHVQAGYVVSERDLEDKITSTVDNLVRKGRI